MGFVYNNNNNNNNNSCNNTPTIKCIVYRPSAFIIYIIYKIIQIYIEDFHLVWNSLGINEPAPSETQLHLFILFMRKWSVLMHIEYKLLPIA